MGMKFAFAAVAAVFVAMPAMAGVVVVNGDTTGGPTWNRPLSGIPPTGLSAVGTNVAYEVIEFTVSAGGSYDFLSVAEAGFDNFLLLYAGSFDPSAPLANALAANDDFPTIGVSGFSYGLTAGLSYFAVSTGFGNDDAGGYQLTISGPGDITLGGGGVVPEPASWAMLIIGFGVVGGAMRRRQAALTA